MSEKEWICSKIGVVRSDQMLQSAGAGVTSHRLELPMRAGFPAILKVFETDPKGAQEKGVNTGWLDSNRRWSKTSNGAAVIRGRSKIN
jgi:hypothetical protein